MNGKLILNQIVFVVLIVKGSLKKVRKMNEENKVTISLGLNWLDSLRYKYSKSYRKKVDKFIEETKKELTGAKQDE